MITAAEALALPPARPTDKDRERVEELLDLVDQAVRAHMRRSGVPLEVSETNPDVIADATVALKERGWLVQWQPKHGEGVLTSKRVHVGYTLILTPSDAALAERARLDKAAGN